jgi:pimeloyl-ACP methyl ester carboxylesterase
LLYPVSIRIAPAVAALLGALAPGDSGAALDETSCRLLHESLPAAYGRCATLEVPEDYADPDGARLGLFFARIPALTANPEPDPLVLINGGPGGSGVDLYLQLWAAFEPIRRERDILLLDQRGTGRSLAGLDCELPEEFELVTATADEIRATVESCIAEFDHDPRLFTTSVAVRDLETLREALGVAQWNVFGVSYGTRVAQHYLRRHGDRVRAMILDGIVPPDLALGPDIAAAAASALDAAFARCGDSPACKERFPDIAQRFEELRARFAGQSIEVVLNDPVTGEPKSVELDESHLQAAVRLMSYSDATVALLPLIIEAAHEGNMLPLAAQAELQIQSVGESIGFAMHNSVVCTEDAPWFPEENVSGAALPYLGTTVIDGLRAICDSWPAGVIDEAFKEPVASDRPVLLLSGEHDPVTPPAYAEHVLEAGLTNARHLVGRSQGHGLAAVGCVPRLMERFVASGDPEALDPACLDEQPPMPFFLSFQGPAP